MKFKYLTPKATEALRREIRRTVDAAATALGLDPAAVRVRLFPNADQASVELSLTGATHEQLAALEEPIHAILNRLTTQTAEDGARVLLGYSIHSA